MKHPKCFKHLPKALQADRSVNTPQHPAPKECRTGLSRHMAAAVVLFIFHNLFYTIWIDLAILLFLPLNNTVLSSDLLSFSALGKSHVQYFYGCMHHIRQKTLENKKILLAFTARLCYYK